MLERKTLMQAPSRVYAVKWDGEGLTELQGWIEAQSPGAYTVTIPGSDGAVSIVRPDWGISLTVPVGDHVALAGDAFVHIESLGGTWPVYPAEWQL